MNKFIMKLTISFRAANFECNLIVSQIHITYSILRELNVVENEIRNVSMNIKLTLKDHQQTNNVL